MRKIELAQETPTSPSTTEAFKTYNELPYPPEVIAEVTTRMKAGEEIDSEFQDIVAAVNGVLDTTDNGRGIDVFPEAESTWGKIFEDTDHHEARTKFGQSELAMSRLQHKITLAQVNIENLLESGGEQALQEAQNELTELEREMSYLSRKLESQCRLRGMTTLHLIARTNVEALATSSV